jgi:hypothetical protein
MTTMLNVWWKEQEKKPLAKPVKIRHVVTMAVNAGWSLEECYQALSLTWAFTESAFETALRRLSDENEARYGKVGDRVLKLRQQRKERHQ